MKKVKIKVVDAPMGKGKTSAAINYMNKILSLERKVIFITPFLSEVERIIKCCPERDFKEPEDKESSKSANLKLLLSNKENIACTHALFLIAGEDIRRLIKEGDYLLILDEVLNTLHPYPLAPSDLDVILNSMTETDEDGFLVWKDKNYKGVFNRVKTACDSRMLLVQDGTIIWTLPIKKLIAFNDTIILTYMFDVQMQKYYLELNGISYENLYVKQNKKGEYVFTKTPQNYKIPGLKKKIHICNKDKLLEIGYKETDLSKHWYMSNLENGNVMQLQLNMRAFFRSEAKVKSGECLWTTYKDFRSEIASKGNTKGFLSMNARATNEYSNRTAVAYMVNRYVNPYIVRFFSKNNIKINRDRYALSEMLQFIWRSAIRNNEEIWLFIPSRRMRNLFKEWLNEISE